MTSVCMNGQSSAIQKTALLGSEANRKVTLYGKRHAMSSEGLGLLDLLKIKFPLEEGMITSNCCFYLLACCNTVSVKDGSEVKEDPYKKNLLRRVLYLCLRFLERKNGI